MKRLNLAEDIKPVTEFRSNTAALLDRVKESQRALVLTQRGHSTAVVLDVDHYERLVEELELLRDIHTANRQAARGEVLSHEEVRDYVLESLGE